MYIYNININNKLQDVLSFLSPEQATIHGLPPKAMIGRLLTSTEQGGKLIHTNFAVNPAFVEFMHEIMAEYAPRLAVTQSHAKQQRNGWIYMIDQRRPEAEMLDPLESMLEDIIGAFEVCDSQILPGSYQPMTSHKIMSDRGLFEVDPELKDLLITECIK